MGHGGAYTRWSTSRTPFTEVVGSELKEWIFGTITTLSPPTTLLIYSITLIHKWRDGLSTIR